MLSYLQMLGLWVDHNNRQIVCHNDHEVKDNLIGSKVCDNNHNK
jgi:hypothetical protein